MKKYDDERYKRYLHIIYEWNERHPLQHCVGMHGIRKEQYGPEDFYCFSISRGNFVEPDGYDIEKEPFKLSKRHKELVKFACCDERLDLDMLEELNRELKAAGAKKVYLHPEKRVVYRKNRIPEEKESAYGTQLILIQDEEITKEEKK